MRSGIKYIKHAQNKPPFHGILPSVAALRELKQLTTFHTPKRRTLEKMHLHFPPSAAIHLWKKLDFGFDVILLSPLTGT